MVVGDNGIITRSKQAKDKTSEAQIYEEIELETVGAYGIDGYDFDLLKTNLSKKSDNYSFEDLAGGSALKITNGDYVYYVSKSDGTVTRSFDMDEDTSSSSGEGCQIIGANGLYVAGDVNKDNWINNDDAQMILKYNARVISEIDENLADVDENGRVDSSDASVVLQLTSDINKFNTLSSYKDDFVFDGNGNVVPVISSNVNGNTLTIQTSKGTFYIVLH